MERSDIRVTPFFTVLLVFGMTVVFLFLSASCGGSEDSSEENSAEAFTGAPATLGELLGSETIEELVSSSRLLSPGSPSNSQRGEDLKAIRAKVVSLIEQTHAPQNAAPGDWFVQGFGRFLEELAGQQVGRFFAGCPGIRRQR